MSNCGFIVNPKWPWLGASPDGVFRTEDGVMRTVEIKCLYSKKENKITDACQDQSFFMTMINGEPKLKHKHVYYYQCQGIMAITETNELDFVIYTNFDIHIERIKFDKDKWEKCILPKLTSFYFEFLKDSIFSS